jgi:hypothetical protein
MAFTKLDSGITKSSLWSEPLHVRVVFVSFLAEKDENGFVSASYSSMQRICNVNKEQFDEAIRILESPDPESRTEDFEGRRLQKIEGGWIVLNHEKYRLPEQIKNEQRKEYMKNYMRERRKCEGVNINKKLTGVNSGLTSVSVSASVSSSSFNSSNKDTVDVTKKEVPLWRTDFLEYCKIESESFYNLLSDSAWMAEQQKYNPNLNIQLSLEKAHKQFWCTEAGWKHKKKSRSNELDWKRTYQNALSQRCNQVWKTKEQQNNDQDSDGIVWQ